MLSSWAAASLRAGRPYALFRFPVYPSFEVLLMRSSRRYTPLFAVLAGAAAVVVAASPVAAQTQAVTDIKPNSWYWGVYGGQTSFATTIARTTAPMVGMEWMITRTKFALNVIAEQSYFNAVSTITDFPTSAPRRVDIQDLRRVGGTAMIFMPHWRAVHPWFGAGYSFNFIRQATPQGSSFASPAARDSINARVDDGRTQGKMSAELGFMFAYRDWAPYLQYTIMPSKGSSSWMVNGEGFTNIWKVGVRYNFGAALNERW